MKTIYLSSLVLVISLIACKQKTASNHAAESDNVTNINVELSETNFSTIADTIDYLSLPRLTMIEYNNLQLDKVEGLHDYDTTYLAMGRVLLSNDDGRIITIQVITDGEISEFLLSYDKNGSLQDNLLVAYEDMVEYYSQVSSSIESGKITVQTINFTYSDNETSDTTIINYQITPDFKFVAD